MIYAQQPSTSTEHYQQPSIFQVHAHPLGKGTYGSVYGLDDPRTNRRVALKMTPNVFLNLATAKRACREIRMLSELRHDNILCLFDILVPTNSKNFTEISLLTEVMEIDLFKLITSPPQVNPLTMDHVRIFVYQMLRGLKYLHSAGILHRDLKPANMLVNANCFLKICDFGLARYVEVDEQNNMKNQNLTVDMVTQYYRAPEMVMRAPSYNFAVDIWSVGCVFYELMYRKILFQADDGDVAQLEKIVEIIGAPSEKDFQWAADGAKNHIRSNLNHVKGCLKQILCETSALFDSRNQLGDPLEVHLAEDLMRAKDLIERMLQFNPANRQSAEMLLNHPFFVKARFRYHTEMCPNQGAYLPEHLQMNAQEWCQMKQKDLIFYEPIHTSASETGWENRLSHMFISEMREEIWKFIVNFKSPAPKLRLEQMQALNKMGSVSLTFSIAK